MSFLKRKALLEAVLPFIQAKRFRGKINIQKPREPHFVRATFLAVAEPYFINPKKDAPLADLCTKEKKLWDKDNIENPYQRILANELYDGLKRSRLVAFYHYNPMNADTQLKAKIMFKKQNMTIRKFGKKTLQMAVEGTPYEVVTQFYVSHNLMVFSPEPEIKKLLKVTKKFPQLILLAGILEGRFVSKDELMHYSQIPNIQTAQAGLVQTLNSIGGTVVSQLQSHQNVLVSQLQERIKQLEVEENK